VRSARSAMVEPWSRLRPVYLAPVVMSLLMPSSVGGSAHLAMLPALVDQELTRARGASS
jgi:hypothetical protein